jgi:hypothetical protein
MTVHDDLIGSAAGEVRKDVGSAAGEDGLGVLVFTTRL